ncbi:hypothetical protein AAG906_021142 [Vitis piasezkii]
MSLPPTDEMKKEQSNMPLRLLQHLEKSTYRSGHVHDDNVQPIDEPIAFSPIDSNRVILPHEDVLVLTLGVGGFDVRIILIDLGSFVNLLQMSTYRQMGINGPLGDDILLVQAGPITLNVLFSIVEDLSPYNAIMG